MDGANLKNVKQRLPKSVSSFELIIQNQYVLSDEFLERGGEEVFPCECRRPPDGASSIEKFACGKLSQCINRTLCIECKADECPCADSCQNQRFQSFQYADVEVFETPGKGFGLRARTDLERDDFIGEYVGEVLDRDEFEERSELYTEAGFKHFYFMTLQKEQIIDATRKGNLSRFMNHSCNPNCATQKWIVDGVQRIGLFAIKKILAGAELTFDYKYVRFGVEAQKCLCGEPNCKGIIGQKEDRSDQNLPSCDEDSKYLSTIRNDNISGNVSDLQLTHLLKLLLQSNTDRSCREALGTISGLGGDLKRRLLSLHCLSIFSVVLTSFWQQWDVVNQMLDILISLPILSRSLVTDCAIDEKISRLSNRMDISDEIRDKARRLLDQWMSLKLEFVIPKQNQSNANNPNVMNPGYTLALEPKHKRNKWGDAPSLTSNMVEGDISGLKLTKKSNTEPKDSRVEGRHRGSDERKVTDIIERARKNALQRIPAKTETKALNTTLTYDHTWKKHVSVLVVKYLSRKLKDRLELREFKELARTITHMYLQSNPRPSSSGEEEEKNLKNRLYDFVSNYIESNIKR